MRSCPIASRGGNRLLCKCLFCSSKPESHSTPLKDIRHRIRCRVHGHSLSYHQCAKFKPNRACFVSSWSLQTYCFHRVRTDPYTIFIIDDQPVFVTGLTVILEKDSEFKVRGSADCWEALPEDLKSEPPDLFIVEIFLRNSDGFKLLTLLR